MANELQLIAAKALPALSGSSVTYNVEKNIYLTTGYTSAAGNTYYRAIRMSNRLVVYYHIGQGYCRTFLNGITLYAFDGTKVRTIAEKYFNCRFFSECDAKQESIRMLTTFMKGQAKMLGTNVNENQLESFSRGLVQETFQRQLG